MQLLERVKNCNGCGACVVPCKQNAVKMYERDSEQAREVLEKFSETQSMEGHKRVAVVQEGACDRCNACVLYCPIFNPVELPVFDEWYEFDEAYDNRVMPKLYRETMRSARSGRHTEFVGTLCEIAALKSLNGDKIPSNLILKPLVCSKEKRELEPTCRECIFYGKGEE
jgi:ferredoxin